MFKTVNNQTKLTIEESVEMEGLFYIAADGEQITSLSTLEEARLIKDILSTPSKPRMMRTFNYNPSVDLNQRVLFFNQVTLGDQAIIFAYFTNGNYSDIFQYHKADYKIDMKQLNEFNTGMEGIMYCISVHSGWQSTPIRKHA